MKQICKSSVAVVRAYQPVVEVLERRQLLSASIGLVSSGTSSSMMVFNAVKNSSASPTQTLTVTDTGDAALTLGPTAFNVLNDPASATLDAARFSLLNVSSAPAMLAPGQSFALQLSYSANAIGINSALLDITTNDPVNSIEQVSLRGIGTKGLGGTNQPSLATILQAYKIPTYVGEGFDDANAATDATYPEPPDPSTQEVRLQRLVKAGTGPVTIEVLASFTASGFPKSYVLGTYTPGNTSSLNQLFYTTASENQTTYVQPQGSTSFDPGSSEFGFYFISNEQVKGRVGYSEDALNTWDTTDPRKFRFFPLENPDGSVVADAYIMTSTEWNAPIGYDFTNIVAIVRNVKAAPGAPDGPVLGLQNANALPGSDTMVFNRIQNPNGTLGDQVHDTGVLDINNTGDQPLVISSYNLSSGWTLVSPPTFPLTVAAGASTTLTIKFVATRLPSVPYNETSSPAYPTGGGAYHGSLILNSNDPNNPTATVPLAGWWQYHSENANEPSLQSIVNLLNGWTTNINATPIPELTQNNSTDPESGPTYYGEEVISGYWMEADPSLAVTVQEIAAYHTEGNTATTYWYTQGSGSHNRLFTTSSDSGQTLFPYATGTTTPAAASFTSTGIFGFDLDGEFSDDTLNPYHSAGGHDVRFFPVRDGSGNLITNTYIMSMDYASPSANFDFQDNVYIVTNIHPAAVPAAPTDFYTSVTGTTSVSMQWAPVQDTTLLGYNVYRASSAAGTYSLLTSTPITATSFTDTTAPTGTTSYYKVTSVDSAANAQSLGTIAPAAVPAVVIAGSGNPVVTNQAATTDAGVAVTIYDLTSATDTGGTILPSTVVVSTNPVHGTTSVDPTTGNITYTPTADFAGTDTFQYTVADSTGAVSAPATITITVIAQVIGDPIGANLSVTTAAGVAITINDVANATDSDATLLPGSVAVIQAPGHGTATVDPTTGNITYTPTAGFSGTDSIQYTISDSLGAVSPVATISVTVTPPQTPILPVASNLSSTTVAGTAITVDVVSAAIDSSGTLVPSTVTITQAPANGTASIDPATGKITYTPAAGFSGTDTLQYTIADSQPETSAPATITFTVTPAPTLPVAANLTASTTTVTPVTLNVVAAATDPVGTIVPSTVTITQIPAHGTVTVDPTTGDITYTADAGFSGTDTIEYAISDTQPASSLPATITITVAAVPVNPVAATLASTTLVNGTATVNVVAAAAPGNNPLDAASVAITSGPGDGTATVNTTTGAISYTPKSGFVGVDALQYTVADTAGNVSAPATLSFSVGVTINRTTAKSLTYTDASGNKITAALANGGTAEVLFDGTGMSSVVNGPHGTGTLLITGQNLSISSIDATGTTAVSTLNITHRGSGAITIGDISTDGPLALLNAPFANLTGDLTVNGVLRQLTIGSASGATVTAQQITSLTTTGNFDAGLTISNAASVPFALGAARIGGQIGAEGWSVAGNVGSIVTGSVAGGWTASFAKTINSLTIRTGGFSGSLTATSINSLNVTGNDTGSISAGRLQSIRIVGSLAAGSLQLTGAFAPRVLDLGHLTVTGGIDNASIDSLGNIGSISAAGISGSSIYAGTIVGTALPVSGNDFSASATVNSVQVVGRLSKFAKSAIAAQFIGSLNLGQIQTANNGTAFGIAAGTIAAFDATLDTGGVLHPTRAQLASTAAITAYITAKNLVTNDLVIRTGL